MSLEIEATPPEIKKIFETTQLLSTNNDDAEQIGLLFLEGFPHQDLVGMTFILQEDSAGLIHKDDTAGKVTILERVNIGFQGSQWFAGVAEVDDGLGGLIKDVVMAELKNGFSFVIDRRDKEQVQFGVVEPGFTL